MDLLESALERAGFDRLIPYGGFAYKVPLEVCLSGERMGKVILVTGINPTPAGEGKTTTAIGLTDGLWLMGKRAILTLREPSMGPVFGVKGGATGGGKARVVPEDRINLHFTGDFHAVTTAHNLISAFLDNALHHGALSMPADSIMWGRVLDLNERALRRVVVGLGTRFVRESFFEITPASEIMAILGLVRSEEELAQSLDRILLGFDRGGKPVFVRDLGITDKLVSVLRDALMPNLVATGEGAPVLIHTGPFANIAHGTNSVLAIEAALRRAEWVVVEAGFGSDLGGEKFFDIVTQKFSLPVAAVVIVASVRALKFHGGVKKKHLSEENLGALREGFSNLLYHVENIRGFGYEPVVAINRFATDTEGEISLLEALLKEHGVRYALSEIYDKGGEGAIALAQAVLDVARVRTPEYVYKPDWPFEKKMEALVKRIYLADGYSLEPEAKRKLKRLEKAGIKPGYLCVAKTQYSVTHNPSVKGVPREPYTFVVRDIKVSAGADMIVPIAGDIMTMPGLPKPK